MLQNASLNFRIRLQTQAMSEFRDVKNMFKKFHKNLLLIH